MSSYVTIHFGRYYIIAQDRDFLTEPPSGSLPHAFHPTPIDVLKTQAAGAEKIKHFKALFFYQSNRVERVHGRDEPLH